MASQQHTRKQNQRMMRAEEREMRNVVGFGSARFCQMSARKARDLADMIRGMQVDQALRALQFTHRPSAKPQMERLLKSALESVDEAVTREQVHVGRVWVDVAGMMKRYRPRAFGRAARIRKRLCHISMELVERS